MLLFLMMLHPFSSRHQAAGEVFGASHIQVMSRDNSRARNLPSSPRSRISSQGMLRLFLSGSHGCVSDHRLNLSSRLSENSFSHSLSAGKAKTEHHQAGEALWAGGHRQGVLCLPQARLPKPGECVTDSSSCHTGEDGCPLPAQPPAKGKDGPESNTWGQGG